MASRGLIDGACLLQDRRDYDRDPLNWVEAVALEARSRGLSKFKEQELSNTAWAFATAGHAAPALLAAISEEAAGRASEFKPLLLRRVSDLGDSHVARYAQQPRRVRPNRAKFLKCVAIGRLAQLNRAEVRALEDMSFMDVWEGLLSVKSGCSIIDWLVPAARAPTGCHL